MTESPSMISKYEPKMLKVNYRYLVGLAITMGLSSMNFGSALGASQSVAPILKYQLGWSDDDLTTKGTILQTCSVAGIAVGSFLGGPITKNSKRKVVIWFNILAIIGSLISVYK